MQDGQQRHLVVAGNGMVGQRLVEAMRDRDRCSTWRVTVLSEEPRRAYDRVALSSYFEGAAAADLDLVAEGCYDTDGYTLHLDEAVTAIDRAASTVITSRGRSLGYDALALATGSYPFVPPVPGKDLPGCFVYRTLDDLDAIRAAATRSAATTRGRRAAWWSEEGCSAWRRRARCACSACPRTSWNSPRGSCRCRSTRAAAPCCAS